MLGLRLIDFLDRTELRAGLRHVSFNNTRVSTLPFPVISLQTSTTGPSIITNIILRFTGGTIDHNYRRNMEP